MNIHEYQAKELLATYGIAVPQGKVATTPRQAVRIADRLGGDTILKAQIYSGGRGKAGGIGLARGGYAAGQVAKSLLGHRLVTRQTGPAGLPVNAVLVEEAITISREYYLALTLDRGNARFCLVVSAYGGMDIEEVARENPERILKLNIDPLLGLRSYQARRLAVEIGMHDQLCNECCVLMLNLYRLCQEKDCLLAEINPLVVTADGRLLAMDAKLSFDDNALFRHSELAALLDESQLDPLELRAAAHDLSYIRLDGEIGCLVNGAGLAMTTLDVLKQAGGAPANFLDVGGGASRDKVAEAFRIICADPAVRGVFVNIFGGIMRCDTIAMGVIDAAAELVCGLPIVVRMEGNRVEEGRQLLLQSGLNVRCADGLGEAAALMVAMTAV